jgi:hypothetical protein
MGTARGASGDRSVRPGMPGGPAVAAAAVGDAELLAMILRRRRPARRPRRWPLDHLTPGAAKVGGDG